MFLNSISSVLFILSPLVTFWPTAGESTTFRDTMNHQLIATTVTAAARAVFEIGIGLFIIVKSRKVSEWLFKNEAE